MTEPEGPADQGDQVVEAGRLEVPGGTARFGPVLHFVTIDSTNRWLLAAARAGTARPGTVAVADEQTAGRGRLGRRWAAPAGSALLMSVLVRADNGREGLGMPRASWGLLGTALALAGADAAGERARLKWPNDLVIEDPPGAPSPVGYRKLAGVLCESVDGFAVLGMGLNVLRPASVPDEAAGACWLSDVFGAAATGDVNTAVATAPTTPIDRDSVVGAALRSLDKWLDVLVAEPAAVVEAARRRSSTLGRAVRVERLGAPVLIGTAVDLTDEGALVVSSVDEGRVVLDSGDVVHLRPR